jgi:hypothetical protein
VRREFAGYTVAGERLGEWERAVLSGLGFAVAG